jgi:hypothetical protein
MAKTEKELREDFERYSERENWSAWLIVAALVMEAYAAWYFSTPDRPWYETTFLISANLAIAAGVYGEIRFGRKADAAGEALRQISDQKVAEANARAEEAIEQSKNLQVELLRRGPRHVDAAKFAAALRDVSTRPVEIYFLEHNHEAYVLALEIREALLAANWEVSDFLPKSAAQLGKSIPNPPIIADAPPAGELIVTQRVETIEDRLTFQAAHMISAPRQNRNPLRALVDAVGSLRGGGWTVASYPIDPARFDAPPRRVLRVLIGPRA